MSENKETLLELCSQALKNKGLDNEIYSKRLKKELNYIADQHEADYVMLNHKNSFKYERNENNLLVMYLLDIAPDFDIAQEPVFASGEFPDIDVDFLPIVRDYLKNDWAREKFGEENICSIGNYTTFGIKSALIDMARVHSKSRDEILGLTTKIGLKDDDGKVITWDKALEIHPDLKVYCDENPEVAEAARILINRKRGMGKHAGGLIVSSSPIKDLVPLCLGKDGDSVSSWTEGLHDQDLQPVGLIKFDLLVITDIYRIALITKLVKERYNLENLNALPGQPDWSDKSFLNDPKALALANVSDLKGVFQFDSEGIRKLCRQGGVTSFADLVAYSAIYRPGPLGMKMHERYCNRKKGLEEYDIHPLLKPILGKTYGVMVYQEQVMQILNVVGGVPLKDCEIVRKAMSKKKIKQFGPYKEQFIILGQENLKETAEFVTSLWDQIEAFAEYGFNKSHACAYTYISSMLLWLKAHYPLEFYTQTLTLENQTDKVKEYINDARLHKIDVMPVNINVSKAEFSIHEGKIYYGLAKVKGIGKEVALRIEENAPYENFENFLDRFGTESRVVMPLIALGAFNEEKEFIHKFYEHYKEVRKRVNDRESRFKLRLAVLADEFNDIANRYDGITAAYLDMEVLFGMPRLMGEDEDEMFHVRLDELISNIKLSDAAIDQELNGGPEWEFPNQARGDLLELWYKWKRSVNIYVSKKDDVMDFDEDSHYLASDYLEVYTRPEKAEDLYYGFLWIHPLEKSSHYKGYTFDRHQQDIVAERLIASPVEVQILTVTKKASRNGNDYWQLRVEDANSQKMSVNIWKDDYARWKDELTKDNFVRMRLQPPSGGFNTYTLDRCERRGWLPVDKDVDHRIFVMDKPIEEEVIEVKPRGNASNYIEIE